MALSLQAGKSADTAIRKLSNSLRRNEGFRLALLRQLQEATGVDLVGQLSGAVLSNIEPQGLARYLAGGAGVTAIFNPALLPSMLAALLATSPRAVAELVRVVGRGAQRAVPVQRGLGKVLDAGTGPAVAMS